MLTITLSWWQSNRIQTICGNTLGNTYSPLNSWFYSFLLLHAGLPSARHRIFQTCPRCLKFVHTACECPQGKLHWPQKWLAVAPATQWEWCCPIDPLEGFQSLLILNVHGQPEFTVKCLLMVLWAPLGFWIVIHKSLSSRNYQTHTLLLHIPLICLLKGHIPLQD